MQRNLTRFLVLAPMRTKSAMEVAAAFFNYFVYLHGFSYQILTDKGTEFKNELFYELTKLTQIQHKFAVGCRPQTLGMVEQGHRTLSEFLRAFLDREGSNWVYLTKFFVFAYNTTPSESIGGYTPYALVYGRTANLPNFLETMVVEPVYNANNYAKLVQHNLQHAHHYVKQLIGQDKANRKRKYDKASNPLDLDIEDKVKIVNLSRGKFDPIYTGPYQVVRLNEPNVTVES